MFISSRFEFGKYKGRTLKDVWCGIVEENETEIIRLYILELIEFLATGKSNKLIPKSRSNIEQYALELHYLSWYKSKVKVKVSSKNIAIICEDEELTRLLMKVITIELSENFDLYKSNRHWNKNPKHEYSENSIHFRNLNSNPEYIIWCLEEVSNFKISSLENLVKEDCRFFKGFELFSINRNFFSYRPIFSYYKFNFPSKLISLNDSKLKNIGRLSRFEVEDNNWEFNESEFCNSCQESPCRCSDREQSSSIYDY